MGLVEFDKRKGSEPKCATQGDRIVFTEGWPEAATTAMRRLGLSESDEEWSKIYKILSMMELDMAEGTSLVPIAYDKKFSIEKRKIEATKKHFDKLIRKLYEEAGRFGKNGQIRIHNDMERVLGVLLEQSSED